MSISIELCKCVLFAQHFFYVELRKRMQRLCQYHKSVVEALKLLMDNRRSSKSLSRDAHVGEIGQIVVMRSRHGCCNHRRVVDEMLRINAHESEKNKCFKLLFHVKKFSRLLKEIKLLEIYKCEEKPNVHIITYN